MSALSPSLNSSDSIPPAPEWIALVREKVETLRYGVVQLIVHDGRVTQIERTEKTRLPATSHDSSHL
jgi:hypothetical protein